MQSLLLALLGTFFGAGAVVALFLKWRGDLKGAAAAPASWGAVALSIVLWAMAFKPDVGAPFAILIMMATALGLLLRGVDLRSLAAFPAVRSAAAEPRPVPSWSRVAARSLAAVLAAPAVGMALGLLAWMFMPGHAATRFIWGVFIFLLAFAGLQVWGLSATRPWRALALIVLVGVTASLPVALALNA